MSNYRRKRNLYNPKSEKPYRLSRSRLEVFLSCPCCFYLDRRLGVEPPGIPPYTLNAAVDLLLKKEFDLYRRSNKPHPIMQANKIDAIPYAHPLLDNWRNNFKGIEYYHKKTNFLVFGALDDVWINPKGEIHVVDYKATSTTGPVTIDTPSREAFKRQMEIYQWLLRKQEMKVSDLGYFVYCNAEKNKPMFESKLQFSMKLISYKGNDSWIEEVIILAHKCLQGNELPESSKDCLYCQYRQASNKIELDQYKGSNPGDQIELFSK